LAGIVVVHKVKDAIQWCGKPLSRAIALSVDSRGGDTASNRQGVSLFDAHPHLPCRPKVGPLFSVALDSENLDVASARN
jgi:hypothetical protein